MAAGANINLIRPFLSIFIAKNYEVSATMAEISLGEKKKGVVTQTKKDVLLLALSTHCYVHSLNTECRPLALRRQLKSK